MEQKSIKKPHTSSSAIETYLDRCGEYYRRKYIDRESFAPTSPMIKGSAVHAGAEENFKQKIDSHSDLPLSKIQEITAAAFDTRIKAEGYMLTSAEESIGSGIVLGRAKDRAVILSKIYTEEVAPLHQPVMVEQFQRIALNPDIDLLVKMDMVNDRKEIQDLKNRKRAMSQAEVDSSLQFSLYGLAYRAIYKEDTAGVVVDMLIDGPKNAAYKQLVTRKDRNDYAKAIEKINIFLFGVKAGVFLPAPKNAWYCNAEHCPAARTCKYFQYYQQGGGKQPVPFWMKFKKKGKTNGSDKVQDENKFRKH